MVRYLRYAFLAFLAICLVTVALANREDVTLQWLPEDLAALVGVQTAVTLPLFLVIFGAIIAGILIGFVWEWFREHKHRAAAARSRREKEALEREVGRLREQGGKPKDEILALLEG